MSEREQSVREQLHQFDPRPRELAGDLETAHKSMVPEPAIITTSWEDDPRNPLRGIAGAFEKDTPWKPEGPDVELPSGTEFGTHGPANWMTHPSIRKLVGESDDPDLAYTISGGDLDYTLSTIYGMSNNVVPPASKPVMVDYFMKQYGLPRSAVEGQYDMLVKDQHKANVFKLATERDPEGRIIRPGLAEFLSQPDNAFLAINKEAQLGQLSKALTELENVSVGRHGGGLERFWQSLRMGSRDVARISINTVRAFNFRANELLGIDDDGSTDRMLRELADSPALHTSEIPSNTWFQKLYTAVGVGLPQVGVQMSMAAIPGVGPAVSMGWIGSYMLGATFGDLTNMGVSNERAWDAGVWNAAIAGPMEYLPLMSTLKLLKAPMGTWRSFLYRAAKVAVQEGIEETLQTPVDVATSIYGESELHGKTGPEQMEWRLQEWARRESQTVKDALFSGAVGGVTGGILGVGSVVLNAKRIRKHTRNVRSAEKKNAAYLKGHKKVREAMKANGVKDLTPATITEFAKKVNPDGKVSITIMELQKVFQKLEIPDTDWAETAERLGFGAQYKSAMEAHGNQILSADVGVYHSNVSDEMDTVMQSHLMPDMDTTSESETTKDRKILEEEGKETVRDLEEAVERNEKDELPETARKMRKTLQDWNRSQGYGEQLANDQFAVFLRLTITKARHRGVTVEELWEQEGYTLEVGEDGPVLNQHGVPITKESENELYQLRDLGLKSGLKEAVDKFDFKEATGEELSKRLQKTPGVTKAELEDTKLNGTGILEWLDLQEGKVSKEALLQFIEDGGLKLEEVVFEESSDIEDADIKKDYAPPSGTKQREFFIKIPVTKENEVFRHHGTDAESVVVHVRADERTTKDGQKVLTILNLQSDVHQKGRKQGYLSKEAQRLSDELEDKFIALGKVGIHPNPPGSNGIVGVDVNKTGLRHPLNRKTGRLSAESVELIGEEQSALIEEHEAIRRAFKEARPTGTRPVVDSPLKKTEVWAALGIKRILAKAVEEGFDHVAWTAGKTQSDQWGHPEEMAEFYDKIVPRAANKFLKKIKKGLKVQRSLKVKGINETVWSIPVTEEVKTAAEGGFTAYQKGDNQRALGATTFTKGSTAIKLFKGSNPTTFMHEIIHVYFRGLRSVVESGNATEQILSDYETLLLLGDGEFNRATEEAVSKAGVRFLRDGKAPSNKLIEVFRRLGLWMRIVHAKAKDLGAPISPEVEGAFSRMLASDEEIDTIQIEYGHGEQMEDLFNVSEKTREKLREKRRKARGKTKDKIDSKHLKAYLQPREKHEEAATKELQEEGVHKNRSDFVDLGAIDGRKLTDKEQVKEINKRKPKGQAIIKKRGGQVSPEEAAAYAGYDSVEAMLQDLATAPSLKEAVRDRVNEKVEAEEAAIRDQLTSTRYDDDAHHSEDGLDVLQEVHKAYGELAKKKKRPPAKPFSAKVIRQTAKSVIYRRNARKAKSFYQYAQAEKRHNKKAMELAKKGKFDEAQNEVRLAAFNHALMLESIILRDETRKIEKNDFSSSSVNRAIKGSGHHKMEGNHAEVLKDITHTFKTSKNAKRAKKPYVYNQAEDDNTQNSLFYGVLEHMRTDIAGWIAKKLIPADYKSPLDLTVEQYMALAKAIRIVKVRGKGELKALKSARAEYVHEYTTRLIERLESVLADRDNPDIPSRYHKAKDWVFAGLKKVYFDMRAADGNKEITGSDGAPGPHMEMITHLLNHEAKVIVEFEEILKGLKGDFEIHDDFLRRVTKEFGSGGVFGDAYLPKLQFHISKARRDGRNQRHMTAGRIWQIFLNSGDKIARQSLLKKEADDPDSAVTEDLTEADIKFLFTLATTEEIMAMQRIAKAVGKQFDRVSDVHKAMTGQLLEKSLPHKQTVVSKDGDTIELDGWYYPKRHDAILDGRADAADIVKINEKAQKEQKSAVLGNVTPNNSFTNERQVSEDGERSLYKRPLDLDNSAITINTIQDQLTYIHMTQVLAETAMVINDSRFRETYRKKLGRGAYKRLQQLISDVSATEIKAESWGDDAGRWALNLSTINLLGGKFWVGVRQRLSGWHGLSAMRDGGPNSLHYVVRACWRVGLRGIADGDLKSENTQWAMEESHILTARLGSAGNRDIRSMIKPVAERVFKWMPKIFIPFTDKRLTKQFIAEVLFWWVKMNDQGTVIPFWFAAYEQALGEDLYGVGEETTEAGKHRQAVLYADSIILATQPNFFATTNARIQNDRRGIMKFVSQFMSFWSVDSNRMIEVARAAKALSPDGKRIVGPLKVVKHLFMEKMLPAYTTFIGSHVLAYMFFGSDDEPDNADLIREPIANLLGGVPIAREGVRAFKHNTDIGRLPAFELFNRARVAADPVYERVLGSGDEIDFNTKFYLNWFHFIESLMGTPVSTPIKEVQKIMKLAEPPDLIKEAKAARRKARADAKKKRQRGE